MEIQLGYYPQVIFLVVTRIAVIMVTVPFFGAPKFPLKARVITALMIGITVLPTITGDWVDVAAGIHTGGEMLFAVLNEVMIGACIGLVCNVFTGACVLGGLLVGRSSSLMMAQTIDPTSGESGAIMSQILRLLFILVVLLSNSHLLLLKFIVLSFQTLITPFEWMNQDCYALIMDLGSRLFGWGLKLAFPVVCAGLIIQVAIGMMARMAPAFNVLFLSLPIRLGVGLVIFGMTIRFCGGLFENMIEEMLGLCAKVLLV